jgi:hypothetical protein
MNKDRQNFKYPIYPGQFVPKSTTFPLFPCSPIVMIMLMNAHNTKASVAVVQENDEEEEEQDDNQKAKRGEEETDTQIESDWIIIDAHNTV